MARKTPIARFLQPHIYYTFSARMVMVICPYGILLRLYGMQAGRILGATECLGWTVPECLKNLVKICWKTWYNCAVDALVQNSTKVPRTSVSFNWTLNWWNVQRTNRENKGLISADRNNKATLLLTIPRSIIVVCYGFILSNILYCYSVATQISLPSLRNPPCYDARIKDSICNHLTWRG